MPLEKLPIGYYVKELDELLTKGTNEIQSSFGLIRTDWQVLNSIKEKKQISRHELTALIKPFAGLNSLNSILTKFKADGLLREEAENFSLLDKGIELHKACFEKQNVFRQKAMEGISEQQYLETILTLQKIIENLDK